MKRSTERIAIAFALLIQGAAGAWAESPDFVGRFGGDRPNAGRDPSSMGAGQGGGGLQRGRYVGNQPVGNSADLRVPQAAQDKGNALFGGKGSSNATMVPNQYSVGNNSALGLTPAGRNEVSRAIIGNARAEAQNGTFQRTNTDNLEGLAQIVGAKLMNGESVSADEMSVLTQAASVDNERTGAAGAPQTPIARLADIATVAQANGGTLTPQQTTDVRAILTRSTFVPRVNGEGTVVNVGAVLRNPTVAAAPATNNGAPPVAAANNAAAPAVVAPAPRAVNQTELRAERPAAAPATNTNELTTDGPELPTIGGASAPAAAPSGGTFMSRAVEFVKSVVSGAATPPAAVAPAAAPAAAGAAAAPATGTNPLPMPQPGNGTISLPDPAANLPLPQPANWVQLDATLAGKIAAANGNVSGGVPPTAGAPAPANGAPAAGVPAAPGAPVRAARVNDISVNLSPTRLSAGNPSTALPANNNAMQFAPNVQTTLAARLPPATVSAVMNGNTFYRPAMTNLLNRPAGLDFAVNYLSRPGNTPAGLEDLAVEFQRNNDFSLLR